jgi:hypothetical protein
MTGHIGMRRGPQRGPRFGLRLCLAALFLLSGCGEGPVAAAPEPPAEPAPPPRSRILRDQPSFALDIQEIFQRRGCVAAGCHAAAEPAGGLVLSAGRAHGALVRVRARAEDYLLVAPGSPDTSYLILRLEGRQRVGGRMPLGQTPLDAIDIGNLRNWILNGAENNE